jgi:hypothetical protein
MTPRAVSAIRARHGLRRCGTHRSAAFDAPLDGAAGRTFTA